MTCPDPVIRDLNEYLNGLDREDWLLDTMEVFECDSYTEDGEFIYFYRNGEHVTTFERRR